jgi:hypothetical protein
VPSRPATCSTPSATSASEIVNRSAPVSVLRLGTEAAIAGAVASPQCFPADPAAELWLPPFSISRGRRWPPAGHPLHCVNWPPGAAVIPGRAKRLPRRPGGAIKWTMQVRVPGSGRS